jgi:hypothetical protein
MKLKKWRREEREMEKIKAENGEIRKEGQGDEEERRGGT